MLVSIPQPLVIYGITLIVHLTLAFDCALPWVLDGTGVLDPFPI